MNNLVFKDITQAQVDDFAKELGANCVLENGVYKIADPHGFHAEATYSPETKTLDVNVISKPFLIPMKLIEKRIEDELNKITIEENKEVAN